MVVFNNHFYCSGFRKWLLIPPPPPPKKRNLIVIICVKEGESHIQTKWLANRFIWFFFIHNSLPLPSVYLLFMNTGLNQCVFKISTKKKNCVFWYLHYHRIPFYCTYIPESSLHSLSPSKDRPVYSCCIFILFCKPFKRLIPS